MNRSLEPHDVDWAGMILKKARMQLEAAEAERTQNQARLAEICVSIQNKERHLRTFDEVVDITQSTMRLIEGMKKGKGEMQEMMPAAAAVEQETTTTYDLGPDRPA